MGATLISDIMGYMTESIGWKKIRQSSTGQAKLGIYIINGLYYLAAAAIIVEGLILMSPEKIESTNVWTITIAISLGFGLLNLSRYILDKIVGYAFAIDEVTDTIVLYKQTTSAILGLILVPIVFAMPFIPKSNGINIIWVAVVIAVGLTLLRVFKIGKIFIHDFPTMCYFVLYLCSVEIAPILCAYKVVANS